MRERINLKVLTLTTQSWAQFIIYLSTKNNSSGSKYFLDTHSVLSSTTILRAVEKWARKTWESFQCSDSPPNHTHRIAELFALWSMGTAGGALPAALIPTASFPTQLKFLFSALKRPPLPFGIFLGSPLSSTNHQGKMGKMEAVSKARFQRKEAQVQSSLQNMFFSFISPLELRRRQRPWEFHNDFCSQVK